MTPAVMLTGPTALSSMASGTSAAALQQAASLEAALPEQTPCVLHLTFRTRPPGFAAAGNALAGILTQAGIQSPAVSVDAASPTMTVSWTKAKVALPLIAGALLGGAALAAVVASLDIDPFVLAAVAILALVLLVGWALYRVVKGTGAVAIKALPWIAGAAGAAGLGALAAYLYRRSRDAQQPLSPP